jgi:hypothetical protein
MPANSQSIAGMELGVAPAPTISDAQPLGA